MRKSAALQLMHAQMAVEMIEQADSIVRAIIGARWLRESMLYYRELTDDKITA